MQTVMRPSVSRALAAGLVAVALHSTASTVHAKAIAQSPYTLKQTFGTTLRLLRVDLGLEVTEKDEEAAYLLFRYHSEAESKRMVEGAVELVALEHDVRVVVRIPSLPEAHERLLRDRLLKKLKEDYGEPPQRKSPRTPSPEEPPNDETPSGTPDKPNPPNSGNKPGKQSRLEPKGRTNTVGARHA